MLILYGECWPEYVSHNLSRCLGVLSDLDLALADSVVAMYAGKTGELGIDPSSPIDFCFTWQNDLLRNEKGEVGSSISSCFCVVRSLRFESDKCFNLSVSSC